MTHRSPLSVDERAYLIRRKQAGATHRQVAAELGCARATARKHWQAYRRGRAPAARGRPRRGVLSTFAPEVRAEAVRLKQTHPHWGPANVRVDLQAQRQWPATALPSLARLSALFRAECPQAVQPRQHAVFRQAPPPPVHQPHQRWQLDAKESVRLSDGTQVTVLEARDPAGALMIASRVWVTPSAGGGGCRKLTRAEIQATLREAFTEWGCPLEIQTDHEGVYAGAVGTDFPTPFTLWLVGLGITHRLSRHQRPTDQPHGERQHRTAGDLVWKDAPGATPAELQAHLDAARRRYHYQLPVRAADCAGQPPLVGRPERIHSGRPFDPAREADRFDRERVAAFLGGRVWRRKVSSTGTVCLGDHVYALGRAHSGQEVSIRFLTTPWAFRFALPDGTPVADRPAQGLSLTELLGPAPEAAVFRAPVQLALPLGGR